MDEMKIGSKFMKTLVAKLVKRTVKKKTGYDVDIQLNEFTASVTDGTARVHLSVDAELNKDELTKILSAIGL